MIGQHAAIPSRLAALVGLAACAFVGAAGASSIAKSEYRAERERSHGVYRNEWDSCKKLRANAREICKVEAKGRFQVAKVELDAKYKPTPARDDKVKTTRAEAAFRLTREKCSDLSGNAKDVCRADAKMSLVAAQTEAKVSRAAIDKGVNSRQANSERKQAREENSEARFAAAKERCDALSGDAKSSCVGEARKKFGKI